MKLAILVGVAAGAAFFFHAMLPNSHAWPLIWPLAGGVAVQILAGRQHEASGFSNGFRLAGATGLVTGAIFFIATLASLYALGSPQLAPLAQALGAAGPVPFTSLTVKAVAFTAVVGAVLVAVAGSLAFPVARRERRES
jgi:hypothetical protein